MISLFPKQNKKQCNKALYDDDNSTVLIDRIGALLPRNFATICFRDSPQIFGINNFTFSSCQNVFLIGTSRNYDPDSGADG